MIVSRPTWSRSAPARSTCSSRSPRNCAATFREQRDYLTQLDAAIGDADHGANMTRGFTAVEAKLEPVELLNVSYDPTRELYEEYNAAFVKRWKADGIPVMVARDIVPLRRQPQVRPIKPRPEPVAAGPGDASMSVLRLAATHGRGEVEWISTWPGAANADARTAQLLDLREGLGRTAQWYFDQGLLK